MRAEVHPTATAVLFELHHLGDAVLSLPFVRSARDKFDLHVICREGSRPVFAQLLASENIHCWEPFWEADSGTALHSWQELPALLRGLRDLKLELACCVWADSRVHLLMRLSGAKRTIGFPVNRQNFYAHERAWRRRNMRLGQMLEFFVRPKLCLQRGDYQQLHLVDWEQLTRAAELRWDVATPWFPLPQPTGNYGQPLIVLHPGGRLATKRWPVERFEALLHNDLSEALVLVIEPPDSAAPKLIHRNHCLVKTASFQDLLEVLVEADIVLCNDSLVSHLAAAMGKKVFSIFGSGNPHWFAPFANQSRAIATDVCPFRPCVDRCVQPSVICLESVTVNQVAAALKTG